MATTAFSRLITDQPGLLLGRATADVQQMVGDSKISMTTTMMTTLEAATTGNPLDLEILSQQQDEAGGSSLYSIEELSQWSSTDCTALVHALLASFSVILVSELGDKTFIITAIMAMKNSRSLVFISSALALFLMTVLSVGMGVAVTVIPKVYTHYASIVLFLCFGLKMLHEAYAMEDGEGEESEFGEVERSLTADEELDKKPPVEQVDADKTDASKEAEQSPGSLSRLVETLRIAPIVIKVFTMVFVAEWGDRSQISTVVLAAREDVVGVFVGSLSGHVLCTGLAVIGGRFVADVISVRTMTLLGGIIFLFFATFAILSGPEQV